MKQSIPLVSGEQIGLLTWIYYEPKKTLNFLGYVHGGGSYSLRNAAMDQLFNVWHRYEYYCYEPDSKDQREMDERKEEHLWIVALNPEDELYKKVMQEDVPVITESMF